MASDHHQQHGQVSSQLAVSGGLQQQQPQQSTLQQSAAAGNNSSSNNSNNQQHQQGSQQQLMNNSQQGGGTEQQQSLLPQDQQGAATGAPQQQFCLRWNNFQTNIVSSFETLLSHEELVDVTLSAEGKSVKAHKVILSACSSYFRDLFQALPAHQHPVIVLRDTRFSELKCLLCFIYHGEVNVSQENLPYLLNLAETLKVKGLAQETTKRQGSRDYDYPGTGAPYTPDRDDDHSEDAPPGIAERIGSRLSGGVSSTPPPPTGSTLGISTLGSLLGSGADRSADGRQQQPHSSSSSQQQQLYESSSRHSTPSLHNNSSSQQQQHHMRQHSPPPMKKRKRQGSPGPHSSSSSGSNIINSSSQQGSTPPHNNASSSPSGEEEPPPLAVNLSVCPPQASSPPAPRLMVLKQELISNEDDTPNNGDKERLEQRERLCNFFEKERLAGMIKMNQGYIDSEGEEEPPPPHEDENSGDMDTHSGGGLTGLPHHLSSSLQQSFVPYPPTSHPAAAAVAAAHHFANTFTPAGSSGPGSASSPANWRSHSSDQGPNSPQDYQLVNKIPLYNAPHQYMHWPSRRPAVCPGCGKFFKFKYNMKIHLKKCAAAHGQPSTGGHLSSSSMALLGAVAVAAASANSANDDPPPSIQQHPPPPPPPPQPSGPPHRNTSPPPPPSSAQHMHLLRITPTSVGQLQQHPPHHHRIQHSSISPGAPRISGHPLSSNLPASSNMGSVSSVVNPQQSLSALHSSSSHGAHSTS